MYEQNQDGFHGPVERDVGEKEIQLYRLVFKMLDVDDTGTIPKEELARALRQSGHNPTEEEILDMLTSVDENEDGLINFEEFIHFGKCQKSPEEQNEELLEAFKTFDTDGSGCLSVDELRDALCNYGEGITDEELQDLIIEADANEDGQIDYAEFAKLMSTVKEIESEEIE